MAAADYNAELKRFLNLGVEPDIKAGALLAGLSEAVEAAAEQILGRPISPQTFDEAYDGQDRPWIFLRHDPVQELLSVSINGEALTYRQIGAASVYPPEEVLPIGNPYPNTLLRVNSIWPAGVANVQVSYKAGLAGKDGPPKAIITAIAYWAAQLFRDRDRIGLSSQTLSGMVTAFTREVPPFTEQLLLPYCRAAIPS